MKTLNKKQASKVLTNAVSKVLTSKKQEANKQDTNKDFYLKAKSINSCSRYAKEEKLTTQDVKKYVDASLTVLADYKNEKDNTKIKLLLKSMYAKKVDFNNKDYRRIERVFSSIVAKKLNLSTSTCHEKVTESVNLSNRELIKSFFSYSDTQLDAIRLLVYKFKI